MNEDAERIYQEARALAQPDRATFLARECALNQSLLDELTSLLAHSDEAESFFDSLSRSVVPEMASDAVIGRTISHYRIVSHIDDGGTGTVYRAVDTRLDREVALKLLPAAAHDAYANRGLDEARSAAALQHPNICVIHDVGETDDGRPFIAMALCEGETLKERISKGAMSLSDVLNTATQIANGLAAAHARKTIHGDIKPANVMLGSDGTVRLLDFGLARNIDSLTTSSGDIRGTIAYMSPEQLRGESVNERTDLWSLGVVMYEMITGSRPFKGENEFALIDSIMNADPVSVEDAAPQIPSRLRSVVTRLLAKKPADTYSSARELINDLVRVPFSSPQQRRARVARYVFAALIVTILALGMFSLRTKTANADRTSAEQRRLTSNIAAYELYTRGRDPTLFRSDSGPLRGLAYLKQAVALDSSFAGAYAAMTYIYWVLGKTTDPDSARAIRRLADSVALRSIALDPSLPEAWMGLGVARTIAMSDLAGAETAFKRALELGGAPGLHEYLGKVLLWRGEIQPAVEEIRLATKEDPLSAAASAELAHVLCLAGRGDEGFAMLDRLGSLQPPLRRIPGYRGECYMMQSKWKDALAWLNTQPLAPNARGFIGFSLARSGNLDAALEIKRGLEKTFREHQSGTLDLAMLSAGLRDNDEFFRWLERSAEAESLDGTIMSPIFSDMHSDPRFAQFRLKHRF